MNILNISNWSELLIGSAVGISVIFIALTVLVILFEVSQRLVKNSAKKKMLKKGKTEEEIIDIASNEIAAVSMALHLLFNEIHDEESNIITIKRIEKRYSPWNSKIYGLNNIIQK